MDDAGLIRDRQNHHTLHNLKFLHYVVTVFEDMQLYYEVIEEVPLVVRWLRLS